MSVEGLSLGELSGLCSVYRAYLEDPNDVYLLDGEILGHLLSHVNDSTAKTEEEQSVLERSGVLTGKGELWGKGDMLDLFAKRAEAYAYTGGEGIKEWAEGMKIDFMGGFLSTRRLELLERTNLLSEEGTLI